MSSDQPPSGRSETDQEFVKGLLRRSAARSNWVIGGLGLGAIIAIVRFAEEQNYGVMAVTAGPLLAIAAFIYWFAHMRLTPERSAVVRALLREPGRVESIEHFTSTDSRGLMVMHWLKIVAAGERLPIRVSAGEVGAVARRLARLCPSARVRVPGFEQPGTARS